MATKIRLQRHGRKSYAFYSIVIADVRAPRDGKFTEKIGTYNPNTKKGAFDEAAAQAKFDAWKADKQKGLAAFAAKEAAAKKQAEAARLEAEKKTAEAIAQKVADKKAAEAAAKAEAEAAETAETETTEAPAEA